MRINAIYTVTASGPINILTGLNGTQMISFGSVQRTMASRLIIQMSKSGTGEGFVMAEILGVQADGISPRIPSSSVGTDVTSELAPATSTSPGGSYSDAYWWGSGEGGIDVSRIWVDGSNAGDKIRVSYDQF